MNTINSKISDSIIEEAVDSEENNCVRDKHTHSCEVLIDFRTCLCPPPKKGTEIEHCERVEAKIKKVCPGKIIIGGILHKTIVYTSIAQCKCDEPNCIKHKDIPFSCYIDIGWDHFKDKYEIVDCRTICTFNEVVKEDEECREKAFLEETDIIKIIVRRIPYHHNCDECEECNQCPEKKKRKFCGKAVVDSEICFVPAVNPKSASVSVSANSADFKVELVCCDLIVVCGFITKTVTFNDGTPSAKKDIFVQVEVPADNDECSIKEVNNWKVIKVEICTGCFSFVCPSENEGLFHKLVEKDIIAVQVEHKY